MRASTELGEPGSSEQRVSDGVRDVCEPLCQYWELILGLLL